MHTIQAPRGSQLTARGWPQEAALRMLQNNLDPEVAERPQDLVVYGGTGRAARDWPSYHALIRTLSTLDGDETMLVQSGRPVGVFRTHEWAPRVLIANSNLVGDWATWPEFRRLEQLRHDRRGVAEQADRQAPSLVTGLHRERQRLVHGRRLDV